ncbi:MAG: type III pantothenate kinase [Akkermansiaceae bacterium]|nr:type III pantothenate kinase [Akkermansiaceae bacterium]
MHLLIDNSNTRTKFALTLNGEISEWRAIIPTSDLSKKSIEDALQGRDFQKVTLCSVVPDATALIRTIIDQPIHFISHHSKMPITIDYPDPSKIGADRLANASAAILNRQGPAIVIDFGTAVTFDVISEAGSYLGGVIAPGTASLRDYLHQKTALLPAIRLEEPGSAIGRSTEEAMQIGAVIGYRGLIREILNKIRAELGGNPTIFATGGDAELIGKGIADIDIIDQDLTMKGIQAIGASNH